MSEKNAASPERALATLAENQPFLIGVRHHSPACTQAIEHILNERTPTVVAIEMPPDFASWLPWLGDGEAEAPLALAATTKSGDLSFYPFANFSPELAAIRWAVARDVPIELIDLPVGSKVANTDKSERADLPAALPFLRATMARYDAADPAALWDQLIESAAPGQSAEALRRAALLVGWLHRIDSVASGNLEAYDLARETRMREQLAKLPNDAVCVVGAFHCAALVAEPLLWHAVDAADADEAVTTSLSPYSFALLDARSGYPAGIRDPGWQERMYKTKGAADDNAAIVIAHVARQMRKRGLPCGVPDEVEGLRMCRDLAALRNLPQPGRREVIEAIESTMARGNLHGRGRVLAQVLDAVMVGKKRGKLAPGTPQSGLVTQVMSLLETLNLPGPNQSARELRLDPLRSPLDRRRLIAFARLTLLRVPYAQPQGQPRGENLTQRFRVAFDVATLPMLEQCSWLGATLEQACLGMLAQAADDAVHEAEQFLAGLESAVACGIAERICQSLAALESAFFNVAGFAESMQMVALVERVRSGHAPAVSSTPVDTVPEVAVVDDDAWPSFARVVQHSLLTARGIAGSKDPHDAIRLRTLVQHVATRGDVAEARQLALLLEELGQGAALIQGASLAARLLCGALPASEFGERLATSIDFAGRATDPDLAEFLTGALLLAGERIEADAQILAPLCAAIERLHMEEFLRVVPQLRHAFSHLDRGAREAILASIAERIGEVETNTTLDPEWLAALAEADLAGGKAAAGSN